MDGDEFIKESIAALEESVQHLSAKNKSERERGVVHAFLENMNIAHSEEGIISPDQDPPDVVAFCGAFEVKEILDPGRRRHKEYKDELARAKGIVDPKELFTPFTPKDLSISEIFQRCLVEANKLDIKYPPRVRESLDLLFYVNLKYIVEVSEAPYPDVFEHQKCGWRSVSFVQGQIACCFCASKNAPGWLLEGVSKIRHKIWE